MVCRPFVLTDSRLHVTISQFAVLSMTTRGQHMHFYLGYCTGHSKQHQLVGCPKDFPQLLRCYPNHPLLTYNRFYVTFFLVLSIAKRGQGMQVYTMHDTFLIKTMDACNSLEILFTFFKFFGPFSKIVVL